MPHINYLAVLAAAVSTFIIGGLWYSPFLFQTAWMRANGFSEADLRKGGEATIFGLAFVCSLIMAAMLAGFLDAPKLTWAWGMAGGAAAALWVALGIAVVGLVFRRPWS
jgi:hypothetical protein